jgi:hypothetical protein
MLWTKGNKGLKVEAMNKPERVTPASLFKGNRVVELTGSRDAMFWSV